MKSGLLFFALLAAVLVASVSAQCFGGYMCDDGECVTGSSCDGTTDCPDGSDEEGCVNIGLAIGLSIFFFILFFVICPIVICVLIWCCVAGALGAAFRSRPATQTVTTTAPPAGASVVTATTTSAAVQQQNYPPPYPANPGQGEYPPKEPYPPQGYPPQQPYPAQGYPPQQAYPPAY